MAVIFPEIGFLSGAFEELPLKVTPEIARHTHMPVGFTGIHTLEANLPHGTKTSLLRIVPGALRSL